MATSNSFVHDNHEEATKVKEGAVKYAGKQIMNLVLTTKGLTLHDESADGAKKTKGLELLWADVIIAHPSKKFKGKGEENSFCIYYMQLQSNKKLQIKSEDFISAGEQSADVWISTINYHCASVNGRPKKLFIIVNPIGGSGSGQKIFEKRVRRIFEMAQIEMEVKVTERAQHALEIAKTEDFSSYDGIVVVGGDGSYQEILHGYTIQTQDTAGVDYNDRNATMKPLPKPIGIIPAGTGNGVANWFSGVNDVETAALRIVRGEQQQATIFSVHSGGKLFTICGLLIGYGFFSDMIKRTDELRWMKRARYPYCMLASIMGKKRSTQCNLEYRCAPNKSGGDNEDPSPASGAEERTDTSNDSWIKYDSKERPYSGVFAFIMNVIKKGEKICLDPFSNCTTLAIDHGCSNIGLLKFLFKFSTGKSTEPLPANLELIENVQEFRLKVNQNSMDTDTSAARAKARDLEHYLDVDGESQRLSVPEFELKVIQSFAPVYGINIADI